MRTTWIFGKAEEEIEETGQRADIMGQVRALASEGRVHPAWFHKETKDFDALGPPGTTIRVYYARHAGEVIVLHAASGKHGRGKLAANTKKTVEQRLSSWKIKYPKGREAAEAEEKKA